MPCPGGNAVELIGFDAGGNTWTKQQFALAIGEEKIRAYERLIERESRDMPDLLAPSRPPLLGPRLALVP